MQVAMVYVMSSKSVLCQFIEQLVPNGSYVYFDQPKNTVHCTKTPICWIQYAFQWKKKLNAVDYILSWNLRFPLINVSCRILIPIYYHQYSKNGHNCRQLIWNICNLQNEWYHWKYLNGDINLNQELRLTFT